MTDMHDQICLLFDNSDDFDDFLNNVIQYLVTSQNIVNVTADMSNILRALLDTAQMRKLTRNQLGKLVQAGIIVALSK